MEINKVCVVIQGPLKFYENIIKTYSKIKKNVVISTNTPNQEEIIEILKSEGFRLKVNEIPKYTGKMNFNNQVINTYSGILYALENEFSYIFKIRSDIFFEDIENFIKMLDENFLYFPAYHNWDGGYYVDYFMFGDVKFMQKYWDIPLSDSTDAPEKQLLSNFNKIRKNEKIRYMFPIIYENNIQVIWKKNNMDLRDFKKDKLFTYDN